MTSKLLPFLLCAALTAPAQAADVVELSKNFIDLEMKILRENGAPGFVAQLFKGAPVAPDRGGEHQLMHSLKPIEAKCGKASSYSLKTIVKLSNEVANAMFIVNLENCPLFVRQLLYLTKAGQLTSANFQFSLQPENVWPDELVFYGR